MLAVLQPLPRIPGHRVQSESIRRKAPHRRSIGIAVTAWHGYPSLRAIDFASRGLIGAIAVAAKILLLVAEEITRRCPRTYRIFPLRLGQQLVALARLLAQPVDVRFCIVPV